MSRCESTYHKHHAEHSRYGFSFRVDERGPQFVSWIGTGKRILDLGCRDGSLTQYYAEGNSVTGVDIDQQALALAQAKLGIATLPLNLNEDRLPMDDGSFDVVIAGEVLEHLVDPSFVASEAQRLLIPSGNFIGSVPNSFHWRGRLAFLRGRSIDDSTHLQLFSLSRLHNLLKGFASVEIVPVGGIGGRRLPIVPARVSRPLVTKLPTLFANDFLFRAIKL